VRERIAEVRGRVEVPVQVVFARVAEASADQDWRGVLQWKGRMEELMEDFAEDLRERELILSLFISAHRERHVSEYFSSGSADSLVAIVELEKRRVELLGKLERFRDQGEAMCWVGNALDDGKRHEKVVWFQRARKVAEAHGFFSVECEACRGLGRIELKEGRVEEGLALLRNAVAAAPLIECPASEAEVTALLFLIKALFARGIIDDELDRLVPRFREAAKELSRKEEGFTAAREEGSLIFNLWSILASARLHEVLCTCTLRVGNPLELPCPCIPPRPIESVTGSTTPE